jgi:hypothetical protein
LKAHREAHIALTVSIISLIMIALIQAYAPSVFTTKCRDGSVFTCSPGFVRKFLKNEMNWSLRHATRAAQKIPADADELLHRAALRQAFSIRNHNIPAALRVNSDQTQVVLQRGSTLTWNERGVKQVTTHGLEEKRAFTLMVGVSAAGQLLPFQSIWGGKTAASLPETGTEDHRVAMELGFLFEVSGITGNYWSTEATMRSYVTKVVVPHFCEQMLALELPSNHPSIWQIDVWSVHASISFRAWMSTTYPWIILDYVPGGCTGLFQPCDVGMQRPLKQAIGRALSGAVIKEVSEQIAGGSDPSSIKLDTRLPTLRNRSTGALIRAHKALNIERLVKKVSLRSIILISCI